MRIPRLALFLALVGILGAPHALAADEDGGTVDAIGHTGDGYYLDFTPLPFGKVQLPRLFVTRDADGSIGVDAFWSSKAALASSKYTVAGDAYGAGAHSGSDDDLATGEYGVDDLAADNQDALIDNPDAVVDDPDGDAVVESPYKAAIVGAGGAEILLDFSISRHLVFIFIAIGVLLLLLLPMAGKYKKGVGRTSAPRGLLQNMLETVILYVRDEIARPNLGAKTDKYLPYLLTVFFFILTCNLLGLIPFGATATANITVTAVLAIFTFLVTQVAGTKDYWAHIFWPPGIPTFLKPILIPIEILGMLTKPFALAVRLFANMTAGHLVILNLIGLIFVIANTFGSGAGWGTSLPALGLTTAIYALEVLVAFIQAYVFTILSALFIGMATAEHEHDHDHAEDHGLTPHDVAVSASNGQAAHKVHDRTVGTEAALA